MERKICEECSGKIIKKKVEFNLYGESLGFFPAQVCASCGEQVFDEKTSDLIDKAAKQKGLWALGANAKVTKVGSSLAVIINKKTADFLGLHPGTQVHLRPENKHKLCVEIQ